MSASNESSKEIMDSASASEESVVETEDTKTANMEVDSEAVDTETAPVVVESMESEDAGEPVEQKDADTVDGDDEVQISQDREAEAESQKDEAMEPEAVVELPIESEDAMEGTDEAAVEEAEKITSDEIKEDAVDEAGEAEAAVEDEAGDAEVEAVEIARGPSTTVDSKKKTPVKAKGRKTKKDEAVTPSEDIVPPVEATPKTVGRGRKQKAAAAAVETPTLDVTPAGGRGRKRKVSDAGSVPTPLAEGTKSVKRGKKVLAYTDFVDWTTGNRVLSCGEGDQLGHPGRSTSKKPRKVDIVEENELSVVQVVAGGVHSALLTEDGTVYACGINEKGTVPAEGVEAEGSTDEYAKIVFSPEIAAQGKIVMITAGASFTAALTDKGSVIAWGNLRDASGKIDVHQHLQTMQEKPIIIVHHKKGLTIVKVVAGENHLVMLTDDGRVLTFGDCSMGQLGRSQRVASMRSQYMAADSSDSLHVRLFETKGMKKIFVKNVFAGGFWTAMLTEDDRVFVCGLNNYGQLGVPIADLETIVKEGDTDPAAGDATNAEDDKEFRLFLPRLSSALSGHEWTHLEGVQHIVGRTANGELYAIGKNTDNALGLGTWTGNADTDHWRYDTLQKVNIDNISGVTAKLGCSIAWNTEGNSSSWGCDTSGQLGLGLKEDDDKVVSTPEDISSAHLDGHVIVQISIADNHALFLAKKTE